MRETRFHYATVAAILLLASTTLAQAGWDEGVAAFKSGNLSQAVTEFQAVVKSQPDWPGGHMMLGRTYLRMKKSQEAVTHLKKAYDLSPADTSVQLFLGEAYVAAGRYSDAVAFLSKINEASLPKQMQGHLSQLKAVAFTKSGQSDRALAEFAKAVSANPNDAKIQFQYGTAAYNQGDTSTAVRALGAAVRISPNDITMQSAYAKALNRLGRESRGSAKLSAYQKGAAAAAKVAAANPSHDNVMLLGEAQLGAKQYDQAIGTFQKAVAQQSSDWLGHYYIGQAYTAKEQYRSAEASLKSALDKTAAPANQKLVWKQLGFVYEKQKSYNQAITAYERAGDSAAAQRAKENQRIASYNVDVEKEAEEIRRLQEEQEEIKKQLEELPGGPPPKD
jgi:tetratricopeptide (TPR) repeat protein